MIQIRSTSDVIQENANLRNELEKMNQKFSKLKTELFDFKTRFHCFKILPDNFSSTNTVTISKNKMYSYKNKIKTALYALNTEISKLGISLSSVNFCNYNQGELFNNFPITYSTSNELMTDRRVLYYKDIAMISDKQYKQVRVGWNIESAIPTLYAITKCREIYRNEMIKMYRAGNGFYFDPVEIIVRRILIYLNQNHHNMEDNTILLKISCDGTNISRNVKFINLVFSLINEKNANSVTGCYRFGLFEIRKEDYESIVLWLPEIWNKIKQIKSVYYDKNKKLIFNEMKHHLVEYKIETFFCADWKCVATVRGLYSANSNFPCLYCTVEKKGPNFLNNKGMFYFIIMDYFFKSFSNCFKIH